MNKHDPPYGASMTVIRKYSRATNTGANRTPARSTVPHLDGSKNTPMAMTTVMAM